MSFTKTAWSHHNYRNPYFIENVKAKKIKWFIVIMDITKRHGSKEQHGYMNVVMQEVTAIWWRDKIKVYKEDWKSMIDQSHIRCHPTIALTACSWVFQVKSLTQVSFIYIAPNHKSQCLNGLCNLHSAQHLLSLDPWFKIGIPPPPPFNRE